MKNLLNLLTLLLIFYAGNYISAQTDENDNRPPGVEIDYCNPTPKTPKNREVIRTKESTTISNSTIKNDYIVSRGTTLNLSGSIGILGNVKIIVEHGATLNINNAQLFPFTSGDRWEGIEVWGGNMAGQIAGKLNVSNSTISFAKIAIMNSNAQFFHDRKYYDGIVSVCKSNFINNWLDICLKNEKNVPSILESKFELNANFGMHAPHAFECYSFIPSSQFSAVTSMPFIASQGGMIEVGNNTLEVKPMINYSKMGVHAIDCKANLQSNNFLNLTTTIVLQTIQTNRGSTIVSNRIENEKNAIIYAKGVAENVIQKNNTFTNLPFLYGYYLDNSLNNKVEQNLFTGKGGSISSVEFINCGTNNNTVLQNDFQNVINRNKQAHLYVLGNHRFSNQGLSYVCNNFTGSNHNVLTQGNIKTLVAQTNTQNILVSAANKFSPISLLSSSQFNLENRQASTYRYYYHGSASNTNPYFPSKVVNVSRVLVGGSECPTSGKIPGIIPSKPIKWNVLDISSKFLCSNQPTIYVLNDNDKNIIRNIRTSLVLDIENLRLPLLSLSRADQEVHPNFEQVSILAADRDRITDIFVNDMHYRKILEPSTYDKSELIALYESYENPFGDYQIADLHFEDMDLAKCLEVLSGIKNKYELSDIEQENIADLKDFYVFLYERRQSEKSFYDLSSSDIVLLNQWASKEFGLAKARACNWLEITNHGGCSNQYELDRFTEISNELNVSDDISAYPSPLSNELQIQLKLNDQNSTYQVYLYSLFGLEMYKGLNLSYNSELKINTSSWKSGTYYVIVKDQLNKVIVSRALIK